MVSPVPAHLHTVTPRLVVSDGAAAIDFYARAFGAEVIYPLADQFYGERGGRLGDPYGHQWMMSQRIEDLSHEEMMRRAAGFFGA
jgi:PhnB protein